MARTPLSPGRPSEKRSTSARLYRAWRYPEQSVGTAFPSSRGVLTPRVSRAAARTASTASAGEGPRLSVASGIVAKVTARKAEVAARRLVQPSARTTAAASANGAQLCRSNGAIDDSIILDMRLLDSTGRQAECARGADDYCGWHPRSLCRAFAHVGDREQQLWIAISADYWAIGPPDKTAASAASFASARGV